MDTIITLYILLAVVFLTNIIVFGVLLMKLKNLSRIAKSLDIGKLKQISQDIESLKKISLKSFQKVGIVKFNPFKSMGGNLSFAAALLNALNEGIVISGLHNRESTRTYIKEISCGKEKPEFSSEEKEAVENAVKS